MSSYKDEFRRLQDEIANINQSYFELEKQRLDPKKIISKLLRYKNLTELTSPILNDLIYRIEVHQGDKSKNGSEVKEQQIDIYLKGAENVNIANKDFIKK